MKLNKSLICPRKVVLLLVFLSMQSLVFSQRFSAAVLGGLNASQIDGDDLAGFDKVGLSGGIKAVMDFESAFDLNVEFLYTERGSRPDIFNPEYDPDIEISLKYAEIPVYVTLGDWWQEEGGYHKVSAHAGLSYARLITARTFDYYHPSEESYDKLVPFFNENDLSWLLGISFRMSKNWGVTARYTRGITPLLSPEKHNLAAKRLLNYLMTFRFEYYFK